MGRVPVPVFRAIGAMAGMRLDTLMGQTLRSHDSDRKERETPSMSVAPPTASKRETIADLMNEPGKAELIGGRIVRLMATGFRPNRVTFKIARLLDDDVTATGLGVVCTDGIGFAVPELTSGRESFSPDVAYYHGPLPPDDIDFISGPPTLAVEVRSKTDKGKSADQSVKSKNVGPRKIALPGAAEIGPLMPKTARL